MLKETDLHNPAAALAEVNRTVKQSLGQFDGGRQGMDDGGEMHSDDGMDTAFCWVDHRSRTLTFAGAKTPLFILPPLIKAGLVQPLDMSRLPNRKHLDKQLLSKLAAVDPQNRYAVPYLWGAVGLAINTPQAEAAYGGPLPSSWSLLFDPTQSSKLASCGVSVLDAPDEMFYNLLSYQGRRLTNSSPGRLRKASEALMGLRPNLRYVDS